MKADHSRDWRIAYAKQARSDLQTRDVILQHSPRLPSCQELHYLQMCCEKICKAYLCWRGSDPKQLQSSHAYIASVLPQIVRQHLARQSRQVQQSAHWVIPAVRRLARQIELLAPSIDSDGSIPSNCEYPWEDAAGRVFVPAEHNFALDLLHAPAGVFLLKTLQVVVEELSSDSAT